MLNPEVNLPPIVIMTTLLYRSASTVCNYGWFGTHCSNKCWCPLNDCDQEGECISGNPDACVSGWFGPSCQYKNLMTTAVTIDTWIMDGRIATCSSQVSTIIVHLDRLYHFTWLRIVFNLKVQEPQSPPDLDFTFLDSFNSNVNCTLKNVYVVSLNKVDIHCELTNRVELLKLSGNDTDKICEMYVNGGRNLALNQETNSSSTFAFSGMAYLPGLAVDGSTNPQFTSQSCFSTTAIDHTPAWYLYYPKPLIIYRAVVFNRDSNQHRLQHFQLLTYDVNNTLVETYTEQGYTKLVYYVPLINIQPISKLVVRRNISIMTICEVETYGELICPRWKWGLSCENDCQCLKSEVCSPITGKCTVGCPRGFYGLRCNLYCSKNCQNEECYKDTGMCFDCIENYKGDYCETECAPNTYGINCSLTCPSNCQKTPCNNTASGFDCSDRLCDHEGLCHACPFLGYFGFNCSLTCPDNCYDNRCNSKNGTCYSCRTGYFGSYCTDICNANCKDTCHIDTGECDKCVDTFYGEMCSLPCPQTCKDQTCHDIYGTCLSGCEASYFGTYCSDKCPDLCSEKICHFTNGSCLEGCDIGVFGPNCTDFCPRRCHLRLCHFISGSCLTCSRGYYGTSCNLTCSEKCSDNVCNINSGYCSTEVEMTRYVPILLPCVIVAVISGIVALLMRKRTHTNTDSEEDDSQD